MQYESNYMCIVVEIIKRLIKESYDFDELMLFFLNSSENDPKFRFIASFFKAFE